MSTGALQTDLSLTEMRVLHVDDEPGFADMAAAFMEREDDRLLVETATSVSDGLARLAESEFDCVISDYDMPDRNGIEFLEAVRESAPELPFILFTGKGSEEIASDAISAGVTDYLQKERGTDQYTLLANKIRNAVERTYAERARDRHLQAVETAHEGISILDADGEYIYVNQAYADLFGYDSDEMLGEHWELIYPESEVGFARNEILPAAHREGHWHGETTGLRADGRTFPVDRVVAETDRGDLICTVRDLTDQQERKAELTRIERRYQAIFNDPNILVGLIDTDGTVLDINRTAMAYVDTPVDDLIGERFWATPWFEGSAALQDEVKDWIDQAASGEYVEFEADLARPDGGLYSIEGVFRPVTDDEGEVVSLLISDRDVTERKRRERELQRLTDKYETIFDHSQDAIFLIDVEDEETFRIAEVNERGVELMGRPASAVIGNTAHDLFDDATAESVVDAYRRCLDAGEPITDVMEFELDGETRVFETNFQPVWSDGDIVQIVGVSRELTGQRRRRQELELFRELLDHSTDSVLVVDPETGQYLDVNETACRRRGYSRAELLDLTVPEVETALPDAESWDAFVDDLEAEGEITFDGVHRRKDGSTYPVEVNVTHLELDREYVVAIARDVTERRERERELERANALLSNLFGTLPVGVLAEDADREILAINDRMLDLFGMSESPDDVLGADCERMARAVSETFADPDGFVERIDELVTERTSVSREELSLRDGRTFARSHEPIELPGSDGHLWVYWDVTEQIEREKRLEALFENSPDMIDVLDPTGTVLDANRRFCDGLGYEEAEVVGTPIWEIDRTFDESDVRGLLADFTSGERRRLEGRYERSDGSTFPVEVHLLRVDLAGEDRFVAISRDISDRKEHERRLEQQNERLEEFASVVSHDLRNPLNLLEGRLELAAQECDNEHFDPMETAIERMYRITEDVLWLAREGQDIGSTAPVPMRDAISSAWNLVSDDVDGAELRYADEASEFPAIDADSNRLSQLLENLFRNAIAHGGDDVTVTVGRLDSGFYVEDDGPGIPESKRDEVFSPGYSTSATGTGFGLNIVDRVAEAHGWDIDVTDGRRGGARFEITGVAFADA